MITERSDDLLAAIDRINGVGLPAALTFNTHITALAIVRLWQVVALKEQRGTKNTGGLKFRPPAKPLLATF